MLFVLNLMFSTESFDSWYRTNASMRNSRRWIIAVDSLPHVSLRNPNARSVAQILLLYLFGATLSISFLYHLHCNYEYNVWSDIRFDCFELFTGHTELF